VTDRFEHLQYFRKNTTNELGTNCSLSAFVLSVIQLVVYWLC